LLDRALAQAGLDRRLLYLTNTVRHFKFKSRGKRRLHEKPLEAEIRACVPWLEEETAHQAGADRLPGDHCSQGPPRAGGADER
jgi:uracil-DNA glycosylase